MQDQEKSDLHYKLLADIGEHINHDTRDLPTFKFKLKSLLKPGDLAPNKTTTDVFEAMEARGHLRVGEYGKLKDVFKDFREDINDMIKKTEITMGIDSDHTQQSGAVDTFCRVESMNHGTYNKKLHNDLMSDINDRLCDDVGNLGRFKTRLKTHLTPQHLAANKTFLDIADSMEHRGLIRVGSYDKLIDALRGDQDDIIEIIIETKRKMKDETSDTLKVEASTSARSMKDETSDILEVEASTSAGSMKDDTSDMLEVEASTSAGSIKESKTDVVPKKRKEPSENDGGSITIYSNARKIKKEVSKGENFRKVEETALDYEEIYNIIQQNVCYQIGNIDIAGNACVKGMFGTGFRVGSRMVMSAYHVFKPRLEFTWKSIAQLILRKLDKGQGPDQLKHALSYYFGVNTQQNYGDEFLCQWRKSKPEELKTFNDLISLFEDQDHSTLPGEIKNSLAELSEIGTITFGNFRKNGDGKVEYKLDLNAPFYSEEDDVILINLIVDDNEQSLPGPLRLDNKSPYLSSKMHIIGHPDEKRLQFDPACIVYTDKETLEYDIHKAMEYLKPLCQDEVTRNKLEEDYGYVVQLYDSRVIFHSSRSIIHGASGSPGIVMDGHEIKVQTMLLQGHPHTVYEALLKDDIERLDGRSLFESGLRIKRLEELLSSDKFRQIREDIFQSIPERMEH